MSSNISDDPYYPTVGERLTLTHNHALLSIETEIIEFKHCELAVCRAKITTPKGIYTASGVASVEKDADLRTSLLEIAETRAIARGLRFSGAYVDNVGKEELGKKPASLHHTSLACPQSQSTDTSLTHLPLTSPSIPSHPISDGQKRAIERLAQEHGWNVIEAVRRILCRRDLDTLTSLTSQQASTIIQRMRSVLVA